MSGYRLLRQKGRTGGNIVLFLPPLWLCLGMQQLLHVCVTACQSQCILFPAWLSLYWNDIHIVMAVSFDRLFFMHFATSVFIWSRTLILVWFLWIEEKISFFVSFQNIYCGTFSLDILTNKATVRFSQIPFWGGQLCTWIWYQLLESLKCRYTLKTRAQSF